MRIGVAEARNQFSKLLKRAARGEPIIITKHGRAIIRLRGFPKRTDESLDPIAKLIADILEGDARHGK
ncbi:type II toxin-antitoxin system prevent-host-death family antitoxin [Acidobacterium sp. S8]|uniref:type II toxin-antitoxin system Phd/YefM family antitoxin n=1 Tax=Acidobacterium sp. S8 TaxID=1641854 RepID=UPI00131BAD85